MDLYHKLFLFHSVGYDVNQKPCNFPEIAASTIYFIKKQGKIYSRICERMIRENRGELQAISVSQGKVRKMVPEMGGAKPVSHVIAGRIGVGTLYLTS